MQCNFRVGMNAMSMYQALAATYKPRDHSISQGSSLQALQNSGPVLGNIRVFM